MKKSLLNLQVRYWYEMLRIRTGLNTAYQMESFFEPDSFARGTSGSIEYYRNKWPKYAQGRHRPQARLLNAVEAKVPGSTHLLNHPLWFVLDIRNQRVMRGEAFLRQLAPDVRAVMFPSETGEILTSEARAPVTPILLEKLERRAGLDSLACLVWLIREATEKQTGDAVILGRALHNVLIMMVQSLEQLKIDIQLLQFFVEHILPMSAPPFHRNIMTPDEYVHCSQHLNRLIDATPQVSAKALRLNQRVSLMQRFLKGEFGFDVHFAMSPRFELDESCAQIPEELIAAYRTSNRLREWGWECIRSGKIGKLPPAGQPL